MNIFHDAETVKELIGQAIGAGSMCWENPGGAGIFDSTRASWVVDEAMARYKEIMTSDYNDHEPLE